MGKGNHTQEEALPLFHYFIKIHVLYKIEQEN